MNQIATTIEQSKKLIELGLSADTADMHWHYYLIDSAYQLCSHKIEDISIYDNRKEIPAWSLSALLNVLPESVRLVGTPKDSYWYCESVNVNNQWYAGFKSADNQIDAAFEMVCYLLENKLI